MGHSKKSKSEQPFGRWMQASLERLNKHQAIRQDASSGVPEETFLELGTRPRKAIAAGELVAAVSEKAEYRTTEEVMAMVYRGGSEGMRPSGFLHIATLFTFVGDLCKSLGNLMEDSP